MTLISGCAGNSPNAAGDADFRLRIFSADYDAASHRAVFEVCRVGTPTEGERGRVCQLGWADLATPQPIIELMPVAFEVGYQYNSAVILSGGEVLYASRRKIADWRSSLYDSPSEVVRISLVDGATTVVAEDDTGLLTVVDTSVDQDGNENLVLLETLDAPNPQRPTNGSRFRLLQVRDGKIVPKTDRIIDDIGGAGYDLRIPGQGYIRQAEIRGGEEPRSGYFAIRLAEGANATYEISSSLLEAISVVTGCVTECPDEASRRAHAVGLLISQSADPKQATPEDVIVAFNGRPEPYFPDPNRLRGAYAVGYDLAGGAIAVAIGPQPDPRRVPFTTMGGNDVPFRPIANGLVDIGAFAQDRF